MPTIKWLDPKFKRYSANGDKSFHRIGIGVAAGALVLALNLSINFLAASTGLESISLLVSNLLSIPIICAISEWGSAGWMRSLKFLHYSESHKLSQLDIFLIRLPGVVAIVSALIFARSTALYQSHSGASQIDFAIHCIPFMFLWSTNTCHLSSLHQNTRLDTLLLVLPYLFSLTFSLVFVLYELYVSDSFLYLSQFVALVGLYVGCFFSLLIDKTKNRSYLSYSLSHSSYFSRQSNNDYPRLEISSFFSEGLFFTLTVIPGLILSRLISSYTLSYSPTLSSLYNLIKSISSIFLRSVSQIRESVYRHILDKYLNSPRNPFAIISINMRYSNIFVFPLLASIFAYLILVLKLDLSLLLTPKYSFLLLALLISCAVQFLITSIQLEWNFNSHSRIRLIYLSAVLLIVFILFFIIRPQSVSSILFIESFSSLLALFLSLSFQRLSQWAA